MPVPELVESSPVVLKAESPAVSFKGLISLLRIHEILLNTLAMAVTAERGSKILPGTKVCEFSMSDNLAYRTFAPERLRRYPGSVAQAIQCFLDHKQTRLAAISLYADDWPLGEALKVAYESKAAVLWQVGTGPVGAVDDALHSESQPLHHRRQPNGAVLRALVASKLICQ